MNELTIVANQPAAKAWTEETLKLREIERLEEALRFETEKADLRLDLDWKDASCGDCGAVETRQGSFGELAVKVYDLGWRVKLGTRPHFIECATCADTEENEASYSVQWQADSGGLADVERKR